MKPPARLRWWSALAALALLVTACGHSRPTVPEPTSVRAPSTSATPTTAARRGPAGWVTYHHDPGRSGVDPTSPPAAGVTRSWSTAVPGAVYAEPLVVGDSVVVATESDTVAALDTATGAVQWQVRLGQPMSGSQLPCGNIDPSGITGTPAVDPASGTVWVVAFVQPGRHVLFGLDLATGSTRSQRAVDPPGADPLAEQQRGALLISGGRVYVPFGGLYGDCGRYHGYLVGVEESGAGAELAYQVPTANGGGIWTPAGAAVGPDGDLYVAVGNGSSTGAFDGSDAVVRLAPDLVALGYMAPDNFAALNSTDLDLGSTGPVVLAGDQVFQVGKGGTGYLFAAGATGPVARRAGPVFSGPVCQSAFGADAWVAGAAPGGRTLVIVPCTDGLVALGVGADSFTTLWRDGSLAPGAPIVAGGWVWALDPGSGRLVGLDAATGRSRFSASVGATSRFSAPAAVNGRIFVAAGGQVIAFAGV